MKTKTFLLLGLLGIILAMPKISFAADFEQASLRFDYNKKNSETGAQVCVIPETVGTENKFVITFPSGYGVNTTAANWTVSTTNIPSDATAWPGIATATAVASNEVTFPSNDLTVGTKYCFSFATENTVSNPSVTGYQNIQLSTQNVASSTIDSIQTGHYITDNDQITVTAKTRLRGEDLQNDLRRLYESEIIPQNQLLEFELKYGNRSPDPINFVIEASWNKGQLEWDNQRNIDIVDYVIGSASNGLNNAPPVVNIQNRTITWTINNIAGFSTDNIVTFQLRTRSDYNGPQKINFSVSTRIIEETVISTYNTIPNYYKWQDAPSTTTTTTTTPFQPASTPTQPIDTTQTFFFNQIDIPDISTTSFTSAVGLSDDARLVISYGTNLKNMNTLLRIAEFKKNHQFTINDLTSNSNYYFKIEATNKEGKTITSDVYYLKTASKEIDRNTPIENLIISSLSNILYGGSNLQALVTLVQNSLVEFRFKLADLDIKQIHVYLQSTNLANNQVLGIITTASADEVGGEATLSELTLGNFFGRIRTPSSIGDYSVIARVTDYAGNVFETPLFKFKSTPPIAVLTRDGSTKVEGARVYFYALNERERIYNLLSPQVLKLANPSYTDADGTIGINLPEGKYRVEVEAIGFKDQKIEFQIGPEQEKIYPQIFLEKDPEIILNSIRYYLRSVTDFYGYLNSFMLEIGKSSRVFDLLALGILSALVLATWLAFVIKIRITFFQLPSLIKSFFTHLFLNKNTKVSLSGIVFEDPQKRKPLTKYTLALIKQDGFVVEEKEVSDPSGKFELKNLPAGRYNLQIIKAHLQEKILRIELYTSKSLKIAITQNSHSILRRIRNLFIELIGVSFEVLMVLSIIIELFFIPTFGLFKTLPFLILSVINLIIFIQFIRITRI